MLLSDGTTVQLRQIRPTDAPAIVAMHSRFSERTRYLRYFSPYPRIPERDLERFVNVDHRDREAFVVLSGDRIVAVGRYERLGPRAADAEVAFVVEDAYQGRGIGSVLLEHLAAAARAGGITGSSPRCCRRTRRCCGSSATSATRSSASTPTAWST